jgi:DUF1016 N-terminal domain
MGGRMNDENPVSLTPPPAGYGDWLGEIKTQIHEAQQRAAQTLNLELVSLYWRIGRAILDQQDQQGWGAKVIDRLAQDLRANFPEMKGFSRTNLMYMRAFATAWPNEEIVQGGLDNWRGRQLSTKWWTNWDREQLSSSCWTNCHGVTIACFSTNSKAGETAFGMPRKPSSITHHATFS